MAELFEKTWPTSSQNSYILERLIINWKLRQVKEIWAKDAVQENPEEDEAEGTQQAVQKKPATKKDKRKKGKAGKKKTKKEKVGKKKAMKAMKRG